MHPSRQRPSILFLVFLLTCVVRIPDQEEPPECLPMISQPCETRRTTATWFLVTRKPYNLRYVWIRCSELWRFALKEGPYILKTSEGMSLSRSYEITRHLTYCNKKFRHNCLIYFLSLNGVLNYKLKEVTTHRTAVVIPPFEK
jgi:hypothetical protein